MNTLESLLREGGALHRTGKLDMAEQVYRRALEQAPNDGQIHYLLGCLYVHAGRPDASVPELTEAARLAPESADAFIVLGNVLMSLARWSDAIEPLRRATEIETDFVPAKVNLGLALFHAGRLAESEALYNEILAAEPDMVDARSNLAFVLNEQKRYAEAELHARVAVELDPARAFAVNNLGVALCGVGKLDEAEAACLHALELDPKLSQAHLSMFNIRRTQKRYVEAEQAARRALRLTPNEVIAMDAVGLALTDRSRFEEAAQMFERAERIAPRNGGLARHMAHAFRHGGRLREAVTCGIRAAELEQSAEALFDLSLDQLATGQYREGWANYESREALSTLPARFSSPKWDGSPLDGRTLLVYAEQGFGDTIMFARFLPLLRRRVNGPALFECQQELAELMRDVPGYDIMIPVDDPIYPPACRYDLRISLLSLPWVLGIEEKGIPCGRLPLRVGRERIDAWKVRATEVAKLNVGLRWAGNPKHHNDSNRSMRLADFAPLAEIANLNLINVQTEDARDGAGSAPSGLKVQNVAAELTTFQETAALLSSLDLLISVDTSVAHLAGALGVPTWLLLPLAADWRWNVNYPDRSVWYDSLRLFRQTSVGGWAGVVRSVVDALKVERDEMIGRRQ